MLLLGAVLAVEPSSRQAAFARQIAPFTVEDSSGRPYEFPFLGGFDAPRPQLADIDHDGDLDLFVQDQPGRLTFFENVREASGARHWVWRTDHFGGVDIGEWARLFDLDGDGDLDIVSELPFSYVRFWRNDGGRFTAAPDSVRTVDGAPLFADRQNIAQLGDVDCNGKPDMLVGRVEGMVTRYELERFDPNGTPRFRMVTDHFEDILIVRQIGSAHDANTMALADIDQDGDPDILWGDFFEPGLLLLENTGDCQHPNLRGDPEEFPAEAPLHTSGYNAPTVGDMDGDGTLDVLVGVLGGAYNPQTTAIDNLLHLARGPRGWELRTRRFIRMVDVGSNSVPALADLDGDGDLDLVIGNRVEPGVQSAAQLHVFHNTGTARAPHFRESDRLVLGAGFEFAPAFADLDGDGDLDLLVGGFGPTVALWRNDGTRTDPHFVLADSAFLRIPRGSNTTPAVFDVDGDGLLDVVVGEAAGNLNYFHNDGTRTNPHFTLITETWLDLDVGRRSLPAFGDVDGDGKADLLVGSAEGEVVFLKGEGGGRFTPAGSFDLGGPVSLAAPVIADLDGDGVNEVIFGTSSGGLQFYARR